MNSTRSAVLVRDVFGDLVTIARGARGGAVG
jgi:hypothetical protein